MIVLIPGLLKRLGMNDGQLDVQTTLESPLLALGIGLPGHSNSPITYLNHIPLLAKSERGFQNMSATTDPSTTAETNPVGLWHLPQLLPPPGYVVVTREYSAAQFSMEALHTRDWMRNVQASPPMDAIQAF
ncbi:uncharacterized protein Z519_12262 [Cladophialophora bantiana CBS 173.52]|uniref:Uncharacterized protein n=1 Tax=Cladophialophora bantiana (strain ATCC 10958 / CBS 173.52 / CDC B-1940 / NIH 8579) TaxID=1442370 RepID=A0A0D2EAK1_CLAB1|nr:uncharacterized protein Z519_12262 [Cladophialophora bantiana CBS 173.52]KIW87151.1 hypothetical protein Z519_12262 [Cladophialophora bantiana CBS 173.52]